jgi:PadR family transcriptional regulator AphA
MSRGERMTTTSYAVLGLLAVKPWSTYELIAQVERSLKRIWPRAQSKLYEEPKKLVAAGYARAREEYVGERRRTVYSITASGRRALARWLSEPADGPVLEFEQLVKIHLGDSATTADVLARLAETRAWVQAANEENLQAARSYLDGTSAFPERAALNLIGGRFLTEFYALLDRWSTWATTLVTQWPDDPRQAVVDRAALTDTVAMAEEIARSPASDRRPSATPAR